MGQNDGTQAPKWSRGREGFRAAPHDTMPILLDLGPKLADEPGECCR